MTGLFVTFEGVEGCGKSTQCERAKVLLEQKGFTVDVTFEPGGTRISERIRDLLLDRELAEMESATELLLYGAARAQHVAERVRPALDSGKIVLCDRYSDSTRAYQGGGRGIAIPTLDTLHEIATGGLNPHLTILLDVPVEVGLARANNRAEADRIEGESKAFHQRVRAEFLKIAKEEPVRVKVLDGTLPAEDVAKAVGELLDEALSAI